MSSQRPFLANFLAAFSRAHPAIQAQASKGPSSSAMSPSSQPSHTTTTSASNQPYNPSNPRTIATKTVTPSTALSQLHPPRSNTTSPRASPERDCASPSYSGTSSPTYVNRRDPVGGNMERVRRGSDSSTEGFRDIGAEKWYVGGRTAAGDERFFKLGVVKRNRSIDRLSLDRLSL